MVLVGELVHRQQLDRRHAQPYEMPDRRGMRQSRVGAPQLLRDPRMAPGEAAHMEFVDHGVRPRRLGPEVVRPLVAGGVVVDDDPLRYVRGRVPLVAHGVRDLLLRPVAYVPVHLGRQCEVPVHGARVRIEEQLRGVPAGARPGVPAPVDAVAVPLTGAHPGQEAVPDLMGQLGQFAAGLVALPVEEAQLHGLGAARPEGEVGARDPVRSHPVARPQRHGRPRPHGQRWCGVLLLLAVLLAPVPVRQVRALPLGHRSRHGFPYGLLLGCARHLSASRGSSGPAPRGRTASRPLLPSRGPPRCSARNNRRCHVSPAGGWSLSGA